MIARHSALALLLGALTACADAPTSAPTVAPLLAAKGGGTATLYKLRFVAGLDSAIGGEVASDWFPAAGMTLNTSTPFKSLAVSGTTINLVNFTHGDWTAGTCGTLTSAFVINRTNWDIAGTDPIRSFAGTWRGTVSVSQRSGQTSMAFDGDRVGAPGGIHNVVAQGDAAIETRDPTGRNDWFQLQVRNSAWKFGSASTPDANPNPTGVEVACVNVTLEARKVSLIP